MSVGALEILRCATVIAEAAHGEANFRSAISRSYYAAYHAAHAWHRALPVPGRANGRGDRHETLVSQLYHPGIRCGHPLYGRSIALARMLNRGRVLRLQADYRIGGEIDRAQMRRALANNARIVIRCQEQLDDMGDAMPDALAT
ncbi:hypothetical protein [Cupriavidus agavae]|uniref:HEPN domain-containing protein n=1 Tax=Cupriavidus agavae TaxID=1001822 RepID=A0A4Q7S8H7_9BURK|nr:hypothetical protein [Cupriavidus agavae]RZT42744.1 hypothetical protein EV147_1785 [Cupriavidus agavae]